MQIGDPFIWWRHQMEIFSALLSICAGNSVVTAELPARRPVTRSFDVFYDLRLNKRLNKQWWGWWFETPSRPLWHHCNDLGLGLVCELNFAWDPKIIWHSVDALNILYSRSLYHIRIIIILLKDDTLTWLKVPHPPQTTNTTTKTTTPLVPVSWMASIKFHVWNEKKNVEKWNFRDSFTNVPYGTHIIKIPQKIFKEVFNIKAAAGSHFGNFPFSNLEQNIIAEKVVSINPKRF